MENDIILCIATFNIKITNIKHKINLPIIFEKFVINTPNSDYIEAMYLYKIQNISSLYNYILKNSKIYSSKKYDNALMECYKNNNTYYIIKHRDNAISDIFVLGNSCKYYYTNQCHPYSLHIIELILLKWIKKLSGLFLHSSAISYQNNGILYIGKSESGKSTMCKLWDEASIHAKILGDERIIILPKDNKYIIYPTPWKSTYNNTITNQGYICNLINLIGHGNNEFYNINKYEAIQLIFNQSFHHTHESLETITIIDNLISTISTNKFLFYPDFTAIVCQLIYLKTNSLIGITGTVLANKLTYIQCLKDNLENDKVVFLNVNGKCMEPIIKENDNIRLSKITSEFKVGEIYAYYRNGQIYVHRLKKIITNINTKYYCFKGDNNKICDPPVYKYNILGKLSI